MERRNSIDISGTDYIPIADVKPCFACGCAILSCLVQQYCGSNWYAHISSLYEAYLFYNYHK